MMEIKRGWHGQFVKLSVCRRHLFLVLCIEIVTEPQPPNTRLELLSQPGQLRGNCPGHPTIFSLRLRVSARDQKRKPVARLPNGRGSV